MKNQAFFQKIKKHNFLEIFFYFFSLVLGCIMVSLILYSRFIRERFPKDIPMFLTEYRFWIILYICCIYFYVVITLISNRKSNKMIAKIVEILYTPLTTLDNFIKYNKPIKCVYEYLINKIIVKLDTLTYNIIIYIIIMFQIIPRIFLLFFLYKDVFFMHKIEIFYKFILIGLIPFMFKYIVYCVKDIKKHYIEELKEKYEFIYMRDKSYTNPFIEWELTEDNKLHDQYLSVKDYFEFKINHKVYNVTSTEYNEQPLAKKDIFDKYRKENNIPNNIDLNEKDYLHIEKPFHSLTLLILKASVFLEFYYNLKEIKLIIMLKMIIYILYLICWSYVLIISYYKYPINFPYTMYFLDRILCNIEDPFSDSLFL